MSPQASLMNIQYIYIYIYIHIYNKTTSDVSSYYSTSSILKGRTTPLHYTSSSTAKGSRIIFQASIFRGKLLVSGRVCLHPSIVDVLDVLLLPRRKSLDPPGGCDTVYAFPPEVPKNYCFKWSKTVSIALISRALLNFINNSKGH